MAEPQTFKGQPAYGQNGITEPWEPISDEMRKGLELAAYICRMYGQGEIWAETILCHGEQVRGRWWMAYENIPPDVAAAIGLKQERVNHTNIEPDTGD